MRHAISIALASALITAAAIKAAPAFAEPGAGDAGMAVSIVHTHDLDLASSAGQRQLDIRIARAARLVCGAASDADLAGKNRVRECRNDVLADAKARQIDMLAAARRGDTIAVTVSR